MTEDTRSEEFEHPESENEHPEEKPDELPLVREQLEEALREKDQFRAMAQRSQADLANYRRRVPEEQEELKRNSSRRVILKFLSIVDDLERAISLVPDDAVAPGWLEGLQLVQRNLDNVLESEGVARIEAEGRPFEPREHEAVMYEETADCKEGMVVRVIREGYTLDDRVLRAAQVAVSRASESEDESESGDRRDDDAQDTGNRPGDH